MKQFVFLLVVAVGLAACTAGRNVAAGSQSRLAQAERVATAINNRHFTIDVNYMKPLRGPQRYVNGSYSLTVKGDTVQSYLPYFGDVYRANYGTQKALNFEGAVYNYVVTQPKKGLARITFETETDEDRYLYHLDVYYQNGTSYIDVQAQNRDAISFSGNFAQ